MTPAQVKRAEVLLMRRGNILELRGSLREAKFKLAAERQLYGNPTYSNLDLDPIAVSDLLDRELERVTRELTELGVDLREPVP